MTREISGSVTLGFGQDGDSSPDPSPADLGYWASFYSELSARGRIMAPVAGSYRRRRVANPIRSALVNNVAAGAVCFSMASCWHGKGSTEGATRDPIDLRDL